jgi:hypothetical protein
MWYQIIPLSTEIVHHDAGIPECRSRGPRQARFWVAGVEASAARIFEKLSHINRVFLETWVATSPDGTTTSSTRDKDARPKAAHPLF